MNTVDIFIPVLTSLALLVSYYVFLHRPMKKRTHALLVGYMSQRLHNLTELDIIWEDLLVKELNLPISQVHQAIVEASGGDDRFVYEKRAWYLNRYSPVRSKYLFGSEE